MRSLLAGKEEKPCVNRSVCGAVLTSVKLMQELGMNHRGGYNLIRNGTEKKGVRVPSEGEKARENLMNLGEACMGVQKTILLILL